MQMFSLPNVTVQVGSILFKDFASGEGAVKIGLDGEDFKLEQGGAEVIAIQVPNRTGKLTIKLKQGARENDAVSARRQAACATGQPREPFFIFDSNGSTCFSGTAVPAKPAGWGGGDSATANEWEWALEVDYANYYVGSNL